MTMEAIRWCCGTFRMKFQDTGRAGAGIFPYRDMSGRVRWIMQHRAEEVEASDGTVPQIWAVFEQRVAVLSILRQGPDAVVPGRRTTAALRTGDWSAGRNDKRSSRVR